MDTPALTPESALYSLEASPAHARQQTYPLPQSPSQTPSPNLTMATALSQLVPSTNALAKSLRPLSPPESPFNFNGAFGSKPHSAATTAPSSSQLELPTLARQNGAAKPKHPNPWERALGRKTQDNPYFPSIAEQERNERWMRECAVLLQASPPEEGPTTTNHAHVGSEEVDVEMISPGDEEVELGDVTPAERKRGMRIRLPVRRGDWPSSPASMDTSHEEKATPVNLEEYTRSMRHHLAEGLKRKRLASSSWFEA